ncbi:MAG: alpha/beta hydrolase [Alphaproteobacteria bacterium]
MNQSLDGPRLAPAGGEPARQLVVFLHGYGADGSDLIALGREWGQMLPHAAFVSPNAPQACQGAPFGRQWFALERIDPGELWNGVCQAASTLNQFIDTELASLSLEGGALALVGFSQGTMMALHVGLRRATAPAALVGYSGALAGAPHLAGEIAGRPPVLLVHGDADTVIPVAALAQARQALESAQVPVQTHIATGLGHGIDADGLRMGGEFLRQHFSKDSAD